MGRAIIFPATRNCVDEAKALVNSLSETNPDIPVYIITSNREDRKIGFSDFESIFNHNILDILQEPPCDSEFRQIRTSRFRLAAELGNSYDSVCILDADMVVIRDIGAVFDMAESGTILVGSNNTLLTYRDRDFDRMKIDPPHRPFKEVLASFCTIPMFINPNIHKDFLMNIWNESTNPTGNDLESLNLLVLSMGLKNRLYYLPSYSWTNIHHSCLKPETFAKNTDDGLYSYQGEPIYSIHGHWLEDKYVQDLIDPMQKNYGHIPKAVDTASNAINDLCKKFRSYSVS